MSLIVLLHRCTACFGMNGSSVYSFNAAFEPQDTRLPNNKVVTIGPVPLSNAVINSIYLPEQGRYAQAAGSVVSGSNAAKLWGKQLKAWAFLLAPVMILLLGIGQPVCAQQKYLENGFRPVTPSAYAFFKYTDNPVNQYNGIPNITVPIHAFKLDGKVFPLSFSYHAGGIRVDEEAGWVGLGWDLSMPVVAQTINDEEDFRVNTLVYARTHYRPDYPVSSREYPLNPSTFPGYSYSDWTTPYPSAGIPAVQASNAYAIATDYCFPMNGILAQQREMFGTTNGYEYNDSEPDIIKVSLFGESLTLVRVFGSDPYEFDVLDHKGYKVDKLSGGSLTTDGDGWDITDPEGYHYVFNKKQVGYTKVYENSMFGASGNNVATPSTVLWYLTSITSPIGHALNVTYGTMSADHVCDRRSEKYQTSRILQRNTYVHNDQKMNSPLGATYTSIGSNVPGIFATDVEVRERRVYPLSITAPDADLAFEVSTARQDATNSPQLDGILVSGHANGGQKHFVLQHSYFQGTGPGTTYQPLIANGDNAQYRLQLAGITEENVGQYSFSYDAEPLPSRYSYAQDYWGYYNGCTTNTTLVPNSTGLVGESLLLQPNNISTNHHGSQLRYARAGTLTGITYPTGGSTRYEYELNTFSNAFYWVPDYNGTVNTYSTGNGLRIKAIRSYAGNGHLALSESYEYSGGKSLSPLAFIRSNTYRTFAPSGCGGEETVRDIGNITCTGQYSPAPTGSGTGVGYSAVTHRRLGSQAGTTITYYTNNPDIVRWIETGYGGAVMSNTVNISLPAYPDPALRKSGAVDSVVQRDNTGRRVKKSSYTYVDLNSTIHYGARTLGSGMFYHAWSLGGCTWTNFSRDWIGFYPIYCKRLLKATETVINYSPSGEVPFATTTSYTYDNLDRVTAVAKRGKLLAEYSTFTYPVRSRNTQEQRLVDYNRLQEVTTYSYWRGPNTGSVSAPPLKPLYRYTKQYLNLPTYRPVVSQVTIEESADGNTSKSYSYNYADFDSQSRARQVSRSSGPITTYIWHDTRNELLAEVKNNPIGTAAYTSFEADSPGGWTYDVNQYVPTAYSGSRAFGLGGSFTVQRTGLAAGRYELVLWAHGNGVPLVGSVSPEAGPVVGYWHQYRYHLTVANNATVEISTPGYIYVDEVRLYPLGSQMTTFVEQPLRGITSMADPNSRLSSYEYDAGNRLQRVRDEQQRILLQYQYQFARP